MRPHRQQPTRLPCSWASPGKNIGVGCHFLLQCMKVKSESEAAQSCLTLSDPMDCSLPGSSFRGIFQARVLEWGAIALYAKFLSPVIKRQFSLLGQLFSFWRMYTTLSHMQYRDNSYLLNFLTFTHLLSMSLSSVASLILGTCRYSINILLESDWNSWYTLVIHTDVAPGSVRAF